jgi:hypothetical protein
VNRPATSLAALLAVPLLVGACSVRAEQRAQVEGDEAVPFGLLDPDVPPLLPPSTDPSAESISLCFVQDGVLVGVDSPLERPVDLPAIVEALAEAPDAESLRTALGDPPLVREVELVGGVARVDLRPAITELGGEDQLLAVAQLVCTLTGRPGLGLVSFTLEGSPIDVPTGDGSVTSEPVSRDDYADLLPPR